jgi:hypothetical protein
MSITTSEGLRTLKDLFAAHLQGEDLQKHMQMMSALAPDQQIGPQLYLGLERAPAGKRNHHDFEGGAGHPPAGDVGDLCGVEGTFPSA